MLYTDKHFQIMRLFDRLRMNAGRCSAWLQAHFGVPRLERLSEPQAEHAIELLTIGRKPLLEQSENDEAELLGDELWGE